MVTLYPPQIVRTNRMHICPVCHRGFDKTGNRQRYCSKSCGERKWSKDYYQRKTSPVCEIQETTLPDSLLDEIQPISDRACMCLKYLDRMDDTSDPPEDVKREVQQAIESLYAVRKKWQATAC